VAPCAKQHPDRHQQRLHLLMLMWLGCRLRVQHQSPQELPTPTPTLPPRVHANQSDCVDCILFRSAVGEPRTFLLNRCAAPKSACASSSTHLIAEQFSMRPPISPEQFVQLVRLGVLSSVRGSGKRTRLCKVQAGVQSLGKPRHCCRASQPSFWPCG